MAEKTYRICCLPGDGIGPEIIAEGKKVLAAVGERAGVEFAFEDHLIGGAAIDACGGSAQGQSAMAKLNTKVSIGMKTITDKSTRNLAEMLTQGSGMGRGGLHQIPEGLPRRRAGVEEADAEAAGF